MHARSASENTCDPSIGLDEGEPNVPKPVEGLACRISIETKTRFLTLVGSYVFNDKRNRADRPLQPLHNQIQWHHLLSSKHLLALCA